MSSDPPIYDIFIVGGGINGCGIARDAAGRGMKVALAEMHDLASATSSASTKLLHGGLRYLEYFDFRLVRESLKERDILLKNMPHIAWPLRFVLPIHNEMRFEETTPASKLLTSIIPWMRGRRPPWLIQLGLILYDGFAGQTILPKMAVVDLTQDQAGEPIKEHFKKAFEYSDCWVDDSRLVALNARAAGNLGAQIMTRTKVVKCYVQDGIWQIELDAQGIKKTIQSKILINAAGPWVDEFLSQTIRNNNRKHIRLVRGSHIVTRKLYDHEKCYIFQGSDSRIIFIIPYEKNYSLIGTTDSDHSDINKLPQCTEEEKNYLLSVASEYLKTSLSEKDILWTYSGIRPLIEDGSSSATKTTRDYKLEVNTDGGAPILNILGGKLTTFRKLAEAAVDKIAPILNNKHGSWTSSTPIPGGDFRFDQVKERTLELKSLFPFLTTAWAQRLFQSYGTDAFLMLKDARDVNDLGIDFGVTIYQRELDWTIDKEWVCCADDFLWRRSKLGLNVNQEQVKNIDEYILQRV